MGIYLPEKCLRDLGDCLPYSQIQSDNEKSFICMGKHDGKSCDVSSDIFRVCWKNSDFDELSYWDEKDVVDTASVLIQGMSAHQHEMDCST